MKRDHLILLILFCYLLLNPYSNAYALREPKPTAMDSRIRIMVYNPDDVFKFTGYYGYQASIQFAEEETIDTISMGDTLAWQVVPNGNRIFIKPMEPDATTNMTVITNRRLYHFELHADEAQDINDPDIVFAVRFIYPDEDGNGGVQHFAVSSAPDLTRPEKYNFNYTISGSEYIAPIKIFDDGEFTYFQFKNKNAEIPAFFLVDSDNREAMVNYRIIGDYVVLERVASQLTLRHGTDVVCVFNESLPPERLKKKYQVPNEDKFIF
jgi:type IV secretion system protein VirB9